MTNLDHDRFAEVTDTMAMRSSARVSALDTHRVMANAIWTALRTLGFAHGNVLAAGDDPATFLGLPQTRGCGMGALTANIGPDHAPTRALPTGTLADDPEQRFDVVIAPIPFNDVAYTSPVTARRQRLVQSAITLATVIDMTTPGGITVQLASHELLDTPYTGIRAELSRHADLIGALRLPSAIQRSTPRLSAVTDLILWHRLSPGDTPRALDFTTVAPLVASEQLQTVNTYFETRPDHILGPLGAETTPWGTARPTVTSDRRYFAIDLNTQLEHITEQARHDGVVYTATTANHLEPLPSWRNRLDDILGTDLTHLDDELDTDGHGLGPW
ncbi:MAG: hypothetical protein ACTMIR_07540 [Cellulomonadaceae bacterium]